MAPSTYAWYATPAQAGILFQSLAEPERAPYVVQQVFRAEGDVDLQALRAALEHLHQRHAVLRTGFRFTGSGPVQFLEDDVTPRLVSLDWSQEDAREQQARLENLLARDRALRFDFEEPPLVRLYVIGLSAARYWLLLTAHHAILDGWSKQVMIGDLFEAYSAFRAGSTLPEAPAPAPHAYSEWLQQRDFEAARRAWEAELPAQLPKTILAPHVSSSDFAVRQVPFELETGTAHELVQLARRAGVTLSTLAAAAWAAVLARHISADCVTFAETISLRPHEIENIERAVGLYINTIITAVDVGVDESREAWLQRLHRRRGRLRNFGYVPLNTLKSWYAGAAEDLFDTLLVFQNFPLAPAIGQREAGLRLELERDEQWTGFSTTIAVDRAFRGRLLIDSRRFEPPVAERLAQQFCCALQALAEDPMSSAWPIDVLPPAEKSLIRSMSKNEHPQPASSLPGLLRESVATHRDRVAVSDGNSSTTYGDLEDLSVRMAALLTAANVGYGDRVGVCLPRGADFVVALIGVWRVGATYVPLDPAWPPRRRQYVEQNAGLAFVVGPETPCLNGTTELPDSHRSDQRSVHEWQMPAPSDAAYVIYTSGSTGRPKGAVVEHRGLANFVHWFIAASDLTADDTCILGAPVGFDASALELWPALAAGARILVPERDVMLSPLRLAEWLTARRATVVFLATPVAETVIPLLPDSHALRIIHTGGDRLRRRPPPKASFALLNDYGPTEATIVATSGRVDPSGHDPPHIGKPIWNVEVHVLDQHRRPLPIGAVGELYVGGVGVARGYVGDAALSADRFIYDTSVAPVRLYRTGDLVRWDDEANLHFVGRVDDQVKIRGHRIEPGEVEAVLLEHEAVAEAAVRAVGGDNHPSLVAYVVTRTPLDPATLRQFLRGSLPEAMIPRSIMALGELPRTAHGKVDWQRLPEPAPASGLAPARTQLQELLLRIWADELAVTEIGVDDDVLDLGADSLVLMRVAAKLEADLRIAVPLRMFFERPTVAALAAALEDAGGIDRQSPREAQKAHDHPS